MEPGALAALEITEGTLSVIERAFDRGHDFENQR